MKITHKITTQRSKSGNKCGHNPKSPSLSLVYGLSKQPNVIKSFSYKVRNFYFNPQTIKSLEKSSDKTSRRTESREAIVLVLSVLIKYCSIDNDLMVGYPIKGKFTHLSYEKIGKQTGLSIHRINRAMKALKNSGLVSVVQQSIQQSDGTYRATNAVKTLSMQLFHDFGLLDALVKTANDRKEREERKNYKRFKQAESLKHYDSQLKAHMMYKASLYVTPVHSENSGDLSMFYDTFDEIPY